MTPAQFPQANVHYHSPADLPGSCQTISAYAAEVEGGIFDGNHQVIVAWQPTEEDIRKMEQGQPIFLSVMGGLPPHRMSMSFEEAIG